MVNIGIIHSSPETFLSVSPSSSHQNKIITVNAVESYSLHYRTLYCNPIPGTSIVHTPQYFGLPHKIQIPRHNLALTPISNQNTNSNWNPFSPINVPKYRKLTLQLTLRTDRTLDIGVTHVSQQHCSLISRLPSHQTRKQNIIITEYWPYQLANT